MLVSAEVEDIQDMGLAKDITETLMVAYPRHMWAVHVKSGVAIIKAFNLSTDWGFVLKYNDIKGDANARKREVLRAGGEILERAHMLRGEYNGDAPTVLEGAKNYSPIRI